MLGKLAATSPALVLASGENGTRLPRGLNLEHTVAEAERATALAAHFEMEYQAAPRVGISDIVHNIKECDQVCSNWCWATSATMASSAFGWSGECGDGEATAAGHEFKASCDTSCSSTCNHGGTMTETSDAIGFLSGAEYKFIPYALQPTELESALQIGPVVVGVQWSLGGGHAITVSGVSGGNYVGHDPEGYPINTDYLGLLRYSPPYCKYPCFGTWMAVSSPVAGPMPPPSPRPTPTPMPTPKPTPRPTPPAPTPMPAPAPSPEPTPTPTPGSCHAISAVATDDWCASNCAAGFCPADLCKCDGFVV